MAEWSAKRLLAGRCLTPTAESDTNRRDILGLLSPIHVIVLLFVLLLLFGARRLPDLGRSLGLGMREFKDSVSSLASGSSPTEQLHRSPETETISTPGQEQGQ
jgi:sec-independent protein translocase protein TatA